MKSLAENVRSPFALFLMTVGWVSVEKRNAPIKTTTTTSLDYKSPVPTNKTLKKGPGDKSEFFVSF